MHNNYPEGADTPDAPWNQSDPTTSEVEVTVSITLSKTVKIMLEDDYDYSDPELRNEVMAQTYLPYEAGTLLSDYPNISNIKSKISDLSDWCIDDFEVVPE